MPEFNVSKKPYLKCAFCRVYFPNHDFEKHIRESHISEKKTLDILIANHVTNPFPSTNWNRTTGNIILTW